MATHHESFSHQTWNRRSAGRFEDYIPGLRAGSPRDILGMVENFNPQKCTPSVVKATLEHLTLKKIPESVTTRREAEAHPLVQAATASLSLLDRIVCVCAFERSLGKDARPLILASLEGIMGWIHFCFDFRLAYDVATHHGGEVFSFGVYAQIPFKISASDPDNDCGPFSALHHTKSYLQLLIRLWTTPQGRESREKGDTFYIDWVVPDMCPALNLLTAVFEDCCGDGAAFVEEVMSHDLGRHFAEATSRRAIQVTQAAMDTSRCPEGIYGYAAKLLKFVQSVYLYKDYRLRQFFDDGKFMVSFTGMFNRLSRHFPDQGTPSDKLAEPIINLYVHAIYSRSPEPCPNRVVVRNFRGLLAGGYLDMHARCLSIGRGNILKSFGPWTMSPHILAVLKSWEDEGQAASLDKLFDYPDSQELWRTFWKTVQVRLLVYRRVEDEGWSNTCDNLSCATDPARQDQRTKQCARCSSMTYCSSACQQIDWLERHRNECLSARWEYFERKQAGTLYSHRSRAFHVRYMEWLYERHAIEIDAAAEGEDDEATKGVIPVFDCTGLEDSVKVLPIQDILRPLSQSAGSEAKPSYGFRESRYERLTLQWTDGGHSLEKDEHLVEGIFQHDSRSNVRLLALVERRNDGYKARYSTFCIRKTDLEV